MITPTFLQGLITNFDTEDLEKKALELREYNEQLRDVCLRWYDEINSRRLSAMFRDAEKKEFVRGHKVLEEFGITMVSALIKIRPEVDNVAHAIDDRVKIIREIQELDANKSEKERTETV